MGGDRNSPFLSYTDDSEESSSLEQDFSVRSRGSPVFPGNPLGCPISSKSEINRKRARNIYMEVLRSYDELQNRAVSIEDAKRKILGYTPGSWMEGVGGTELSDYEVPKTTTILLIGTEGSGKSTLVNKISDVFESESFTSQRAQESFNPSIGDGTCFLQEYMIPRCAKPLCLYDTRSLSDKSSENEEMLKHWMTKGVCHGEPIMRDSDDEGLKTRMKCKAHNGYSPIEARPINFVVFVVNALSVLESMQGGDETKKPCTQIVSRVFNSPFLSFKDDKPVVVVTHGDLLSLSDRVRVRVHLGELLGIHPKKQIFDIPESDDSATKLAMLDMLHYCLDHADKNLPFKYQFLSQTNVSRLLQFIFLLVALPLGIVFGHIPHAACTSSALLVALQLLIVFGVFYHGHVHHDPCTSSAPDADRVPHTARTISIPDAHNFQHTAKDSSSARDAHKFQHAAKDSSLAPDAHNFQQAAKDSSSSPGAHNFQHTAKDSSSASNAHNFQHAAKDSSSMPDAQHRYHAARDSSTESYAQLDWSKIRHLWYDD